MNLQRRRFFEALGRIAGAQQSQADRDRLVPYLQELGRAHRKFGVAAKAAWADRDVYTSGPDHMIVKTARVIRERGAPDRLIHYDLAPKRMSRTSSGACRRTRRSAAMRPRPRPCRTAAAPAR
jgi:ferredoxin-NADP reductase